MKIHTLEYDASSVSNKIKLGTYYKNINQKHILSYGEDGAQNIRQNIIATFTESLHQLENKNKNNNLLLVGKVQSGKTSNLELFTALAFDNGFNVVVIYGGYDGTLLKQTTDRFQNTFEISNTTNYSDNSPVIFSSDDSDKLLTLDNEIFEDLIEANKPIFIISMKRPAALNKVNKLLERIDKTNIKPLIIDDEGDQASLNTKKNKETEASATYAAIVTMKAHLNDPLYLSVTATPQALVFLDDFSQLRPDSIRLIEPGCGYCGIEEYHLYDSDKIELISESDQQDLINHKFPASLKTAINHYIIASAILYKRSIKSSEMIFHQSRNVTDHNNSYRILSSYIQKLKNEVDLDDLESQYTTKIEFFNTFQKLFTPKIKKLYSFDELWEIIKFKIVCRLNLVLKNSTGKVTQATEGLRKYKIYIGGDLLQRGVTFPHLVTTYFCRWPKDSGNMDTNLQRARWFGYREKWIDICKVFTTESIAREFTNLSEIENDLWEQFYSIQSGEMLIDEILIRADNTKQKPTRKNVVSYNCLSFRNKWINQRIGIFDKNKLLEINTFVESFLSSCEMTQTKVGRTDGRSSAKYALISPRKIIEFLKQVQIVFDLEPFERKAIIDLIDTKNNIPIIIMENLDGAERRRSFYPNHQIHALQQGPDNKDLTKALYLGDKHVIVDKDQVNIQIHKVVPIVKNTNGSITNLIACTQYMFSIYLPKDKKFFVKV